MNYKPLSLALKQLQPKPESPHRRGEMERVQKEMGEGGGRQSNGESDFRTNGNEGKTDGEKVTEG